MNQFETPSVRTNFFQTEWQRSLRLTFWNTIMFWGVGAAWCSSVLMLVPQAKLGTAIIHLLLAFLMAYMAGEQWAARRDSKRRYDQTYGDHDELLLN